MPAPDTVPGSLDLRPTPGAPTPGEAARPLSLLDVSSRWAPLAGSWLLMGLELPAVSAVMARLPHATVSLAAYGGVVFPLALLIESPILMLLAASTALARDTHSYAIVRRFMFTAASLLTMLHVLVAFTPLFDLVACGSCCRGRSPSPIAAPSRAC